MKKSRFTESQLIKVLKENKQGRSDGELSRELGMDNIERLWPSVKYESIYLNPPNSGLDLFYQLNNYFNFYNNQRRCQGIDHQLPFKRELTEQRVVA